MTLLNDLTRRCWAAIVGALLLTAVFAATALGEHSLIEVASTGPVGGNGAYTADFNGASADGTHVFIRTSEPLVSADTDTSPDIYDRAGGQTTLVTTGPTGGNGAFDVTFRAVSADGTRVFFRTDETLVSGDTDIYQDIYERAGGQTTLITTGPTGGNGYSDMELQGTSADGTRVFFRTTESLVSGDTDPYHDVYERAGGQTTLLSTGPAGGNGDFSADLGGVSADGTRAFIHTAERLVSADTDLHQDLYERSGGQTTLLSIGSAGGNGARNAFFVRASTDGTRVFFETDESLVSGDTDISNDLYESAGGPATLVSTGPTGGNGAFTASINGASADGTRVFFRTDESLVSADTDSVRDGYERAGGQTTLVTTGPTGGNGALGADVNGVSADGTRVFVGTLESLVSADTDSSFDVYERAGGQTTLISTGSINGNLVHNANFSGASGDGTRVFFETNEKLVSADTDVEKDVYERAGGQTTLISIGPAGGNSAEQADFGRASTDGTRVIFATSEILVSGDTDLFQDIYVKRIPASEVPENTAPSTISGSAKQGQTLTRAPGSWSNSPTGYAYQWLRCDGAGANCVAIAGASGQTYALGAADVGSTIRVRETASNDSGPGLPATSAQTAVVAASPGGGGAGGGGGGGGGAGGGAGTPSIGAIPKAIFGRVQTLRKSLVVTVNCGTACTATASGTLSVPNASKAYRLTKVTKSIRAGSKAKLTLKLSKKARKAAKRALKRRKRVKAKLKIVIKDAAGHKVTKRLTIKLKLR